MKPNFLTLTLLTFATALLLAPFALSPFYLPIIRDNNFQFYQLLHEFENRYNTSLAVTLLYL